MYMTIRHQQERDVATSVITASHHNKFHSRVYDTILLGIYSKVYGKIKYYDCFFRNYPSQKKLILSIAVIYLHLSQSFDDRIEVSFHHVVFYDIIVCLWLFRTLRKYVIKGRFLGNAYFTGNMSEFSPQILSEIFLVSGKNLRDIVINLLTFSLKGLKFPQLAPRF